jgi:hypothetical protein
MPSSEIGGVVDVEHKSTAIRITTVADLRALALRFESMGAPLSALCLP